MIRSGGLVVTIGLPVVFLFGSCAPRSVVVPLDTTAVTAVHLLDLVREQSRRLKTLSGTGNISFDSRSVSGSASFEVSLRKPDSLLAIFEGPFGVDVGSLFLSRERFLLYNPQENTLITGTPEATTLGSLIPFDLSFDELLGAFSGSFILPDSSARIRTYEIDQERFLVSADCGSMVCYYWIDNQFLQVTDYEMRDTGGQVLIRAAWSSFTESGGASAPRRVAIWFPQENRQVALNYSSISINPPNPSFAYSFPEDAKTLKR